MTLCIIVVLGYPARLHFNVSIVVTVRGSSSWLVLACVITVHPAVVSVS
jgi:hypothetical protein